MHVHIVYCHPSEDSLTAEVRDAFIRGLDESGKTYTISDLYKQNFQTDMTEAEYLRDAHYDAAPPLAEDVMAEQALVNAADALVFIYPVFWTEAPAKLVGWFDRVWSFGFAYGQDGALASAPSTAGVMPMRALDRALVIAIAGNTKETLIEQGRLQSMENVMLDDRIHDRARNKQFVLLGGTEHSNPKRRAAMREQHLATARQLAREL
jgi:NAD(P)H dehydrogenase (quinone)